MLEQMRRIRTRQTVAILVALLLALNMAPPTVASASDGEEAADGNSADVKAETTDASEGSAPNPEGESKAIELEDDNLPSRPSDYDTTAQDCPVEEAKAASPDEALGLLVAIIDTGCDATLCEHAVSVIDEDPSDANGHGTSLANEVLDQDPKARILSIKALDEQGQGSATDVCTALRIAIDEEADIISLPATPFEPSEQIAIDGLVDEALGKGATLLAATSVVDAGSYRAFSSAFAHSELQCRLHVSNIGDSQWMPISKDDPFRTKDANMTASTFGNFVNGYWQHIENMAFRVVRNGGPDGGIAYRVYYRNGGWDAWRSDGEYSPGATGYGNAAMALQAVLTGNMAAAYTLTYRVRISDADPITKEDGRNSPLGWTWPQASDGGTAGTTDYSYGLEDVRMWLTPKSYVHTVQVRYQNADGSYGGWSNARSEAYAFGSTVPGWSRAEDAFYNTASIGAYTAGFSTTNKQVSISRKSYYLDVNGRLDGSDMGGLGVYGTFDFIVNGSKLADDAADYYQTSLAGSSWNITDIRAKPGYTFDGAVEGSTSGTLGGANTQAARLAFHTNTYTVAFDGNGANRGSMNEQPMRCHAETPLASCAYEREGYSFTGWNTKPDGSGTPYSDGETISNLSLADGATVKLYAQWQFNPRLPATGSNDMADTAAAAFLLATYGSATAITNRRRRP